MFEKSMVRGLMAVVLMVSSVLSSARIAAAQVTLNFNSLPSAQGWSYDNYGYPAFTESQAFSVSSGALHQNTLAAGFVGSGNIQYDYSGPGFSEDSFSIEVTARVTDYAIYPG